MRSSSRPIRRLLAWSALGLAGAALAAAGGYAWIGLGVAAAFPAKLACSCLHVERRELAACREDVAHQGFGWVSLSVEAATGAVRARAAVRSARAVPVEDGGCVLR